jgi:hypothetical protein
MSVASAETGKDLMHCRHDSHASRRSVNVDIGPLPIHSAMDLPHILARSISQRTGGRVRLPQVQIFGSRVVVSGWAKSYHTLQLALAGLLETYDAMGLDRPGVIDLDIAVVAEEPGRRVENAR